MRKKYISEAACERGEQGRESELITLWFNQKLVVGQDCAGVGPGRLNSLSQTQCVWKDKKLLSADSPSCSTRREPSDNTQPGCGHGRDPARYASTAALRAFKDTP